MLSDFEAANRLLEIQKEFDTERSHVKADELLVRILRELEYTLTADTFELMDKWYA